MTASDPALPDADRARLLPLFIYGTLRDPDLRAFILGDQRADLYTRPATLAGYARQEIASFGYPFLVPDPGAHVEGELLLGVTAADYAILDAYEDVDLGLYVRVALMVQTPHGTASAWTYVKGPSAP